MTTKYTFYNPVCGYNYAEKESVAIQLLVNSMLEFYMMHTHFSPITILNNNEDGTTTWTKAKTEEDSKDPDFLKKEYIKYILEEIHKFGYTFDKAISEGTA